MTRPKGKLIALLAIFAAIGLVTASGAFTSVQAQRTANVTVAGDSAALLGLEPHANTNNQYAATTSDGELYIRFNSSATNVDGAGVNQDALTQAKFVFNITNQGSNTVEVWINPQSGVNTSAVTFYNGTANSPFSMDITDSATDAGSASNSVSLAPGEKAQVSMEIDLRGAGQSPGDGILTEITIYADTP